MIRVLLAKLVGSSGGWGLVQSATYRVLRAAGGTLDHPGGR